MIIGDRRGLLSRRMLFLLVAMLGIGALVFGPLRTWAGKLMDTNASRQEELERRVRAKQFAGMEHHLENAGIEIEGVTGASVGTAATQPTKTKGEQPGFFARWWRRVRGTSEPPPSRPLPALPDSLGLRPGERMFLPDGRVVHYDSTTFRMKTKTKP